MAKDDLYKYNDTTKNKIIDNNNNIDIKTQEKIKNIILHHDNPPQDISPLRASDFFNPAPPPLIGVESTDPE